MNGYYCHRLEDDLRVYLRVAVHHGEIGMNDSPLIAETGWCDLERRTGCVGVMLIVEQFVWGRPVVRVEDEDNHPYFWRRRKSSIIKNMDLWYTVLLQFPMSKVFTHRYITIQHTPSLQLVLYPLEFPLSDAQDVVVSQQFFDLCPFSPPLVFVCLFTPSTSLSWSPVPPLKFLSWEGREEWGGRRAQTVQIQTTNSHTHTHTHKHTCIFERGPKPEFLVVSVSHSVSPVSHLVPFPSTTSGCAFRWLKFARCLVLMNQMFGKLKRLTSDFKHLSVIVFENVCHMFYFWKHLPDDWKKKTSGREK